MALIIGNFQIRRLWKNALNPFWQGLCLANSDSNWPLIWFQTWKWLNFLRDISWYKRAPSRYYIHSLSWGLWKYQERVLSSKIFLDCRMFTDCYLESTWCLSLFNQIFTNRYKQKRRKASQTWIFDFGMVFCI